MAATELGSQRRHEGADLIAALRDAGVDMDAAFWLFDVSLKEWRLVLVTPEIETRGPRQLHRDALRALKMLPHSKTISLYDIDIQSPYSPTVALFASKFPGSASISDVDLHSSFLELENVTIDGDHIHHIGSYFMNRTRILQMNGGAEALPARSDEDSPGWQSP